MKNGLFEDFVQKKLLMLVVLTLVGILSSCSLVGRGSNESPPGYNLNEPVIVKLPTELDEISGLAFYPPDTSVFAIVDEYGLLYKVYLNRPKYIEKWRFGKVADYEDLVLLDSNFYVLNSVGIISAFSFLSEDTLAYEEYPLPSIEGNNEFEILYYDRVTKKLTMICKDCEADSKAQLSGFTFDPHERKYDEKGFVIDVQQIAQLAGEQKIKFKPSAAAIHPVTGELYIISSINLMLVVADRNGNAKKIYRLERGNFKQPEGITFTPEGDLIISNEAAERGVANIMIFRYNNTEQDSK